MNREILFRGKPANSLDFIFGNYCYFGDDNTHCISKWESISIDSETGFQELKMNWVECAPKTVSQFTGLTDKNGNKIFEGDILSIKEFWNTGMDLSCEERDLFEINDLKGDLHDEYITDVIYDPGCFVIKTKPDDYDCFASVLDGKQKHSQPIFDCEIIGNIYDNPGLLK